MSRAIPRAQRRETERRVLYPTGGWVQVKSADNPDSLRGEGLDFVVLDECSLMREQAWTESLRPALSDRRGGAMFIGTPKGRNWFYALWRRGQGGEDGWESWRFPTASNPLIAPQEIEEARALLPERVFAQEYLADFVDDAGAVFRRVMECATSNYLPRPEEGHEYVFGVDWGKHNDFTVITVLDIQTGAVVAMDRYNVIDYALQVGRLAALAETWKPRAIIAEANAMGEPIVEQLVRQGLPVVAFTTTNATKTLLIEELQLAFERSEIAIPPDPILIEELQSFAMRRLPSGAIHYAAPEGLHDDCVMSLALAWHGGHQAAPAVVEI